MPVQVIERVMPPAALVQDTTRPAWSGRTNMDLIEHAIDLGAALDSCNADKGALRAWMQNNAGPEGPKETKGDGR